MRAPVILNLLYDGFNSKFSSQKKWLMPVLFSYSLFLDVIYLFNNIFKY